MAIIDKAGINFLAFLFGTTFSLYPFFFKSLLTDLPQKVYLTYFSVLALVHFVFVNIILYAVIQRKFAYKIAMIAGNLGATFAIGFLLCLYSVEWHYFGRFIMAKSFFHWADFQIIATTNPDKELSINSYLLQTRSPLNMAAFGSCVEFALEWYFFPHLKEQLWCVSLIGVLMTLCGDGLRKVTNLTAAANFNQNDLQKRKGNHVLVTHGVYRWSRHPSYLGCFIWSLGTQIMLCNPVCLLAYAAGAWNFFKWLIYYEEQRLINQFGKDYVVYQSQVPTRLPGVQGYSQSWCLLMDKEDGRKNE